MPSTAISDSERSFSARYEVGDLIGGKYELLRKAGEGAMGTVWVANNRSLDLKVAIKLIKPEIRSPAIDERLLREARAVAMLSHSAIVRVYDRGETHRGDPYIVMELLEGESLGKVLEREKTMAPEVAISLLLPVASAIAAAHDRGVVHRDLKPDNIMLARGDGGRIQPKVVDFGVVKLTWVGPAHKSTGAAMIGTPDYMSPEQALALETVDHRADIWAFCAMLYELILGEVPFASNNAFRVLCAVVQTPVRSLVERCGTDPELWALLERGLRKDPAERWSSMRELGEALAAWLLAQGVYEDICGASLRTQWLEKGETQRPPSDSGLTRLSVSIVPASPHGQPTEADAGRRAPIPAAAGGDRRSIPHAAEYDPPAPSLPFPLVSSSRADPLPGEPGVELALQRTLRGAGNETSRASRLSLRGRLAVGVGMALVAAVMALGALIPARLAGSFASTQAAAAAAPAPVAERFATEPEPRSPVGPTAESARPSPGPTATQAAPARSAAVVHVAASLPPRAAPRKPAAGTPVRAEDRRSQEAALSRPEEPKTAAVGVAVGEAPIEVATGAAEVDTQPGGHQEIAAAPEAPPAPLAGHAAIQGDSQAEVAPEPR